MPPTQNLKVFPEPALNCPDFLLNRNRKPDPEIPEIRIFESCRASSGLSIRTYNVQMSFGGKNSDRHLPEENRRADSETGDIYNLTVVRC